MPGQTTRLHDLSGKAVIARAESIKVGSLSDILFSPRDGRIGALLVETGGGFAGLGQETQAIAGDAVQAIGPDAVIIRDRASVIENAERIDRTGLVSARDLKGRAVVTDEGERLGAVDDFYLDLEGGRIVGYVVGTDRGGGPLGLGMGQERREDERIIPVQSDVTVGPDLITVPATALRRGRIRSEEGYTGTEERPTRERGEGPDEPWRH